MRRREFLLSTLAGALAAQSARASEAPHPASVIVLWMNGGPSHLDTWDPKAKGPTKARRTRLAGLDIAEDMPLIADVADRLCVVRSLSSKEGNHQRAQYVGRTSYSPNPTVEHPSLGAWVAKRLTAPDSGLPPFVSLGGPSLGAGFLGAQYGPFVIGKAGALPDGARPTVSDARLARRLGLLGSLEDGFSQEIVTPLITERRALYESARRFMASDALAAFDVSAESAATRARYGATDFGTACLTARRLVERGVRVVEVMLDGWDTHEDNFTRVKKQLAILDPAMAALVTDVSQAKTGMLSGTVILWLGEFGRTPRINGRDGRDHHPKAFSAVRSGAGVAPGIVGATDAEGANVVGKSVSVADLLATVYTLVGISPSQEFESPSRRPIAITDLGVPIAAARR